MLCICTTSEPWPIPLWLCLLWCWKSPCDASSAPSHAIRKRPCLAPSGSPSYPICALPGSCFNCITRPRWSQELWGMLYWDNNCTLLYRSTGTRNGSADAVANRRFLSPILCTDCSVCMVSNPTYPIWRPVYRFYFTTGQDDSKDPTTWYRILYETMLRYILEGCSALHSAWL